jgi:hypothetical protein
MLLCRTLTVDIEMHRFGDLVPSLGATIAARTAFAHLRTWSTFGQKVTFPLKPPGSSRKRAPSFQGGAQTCKILQNPVANVKMAVWNNLSAERCVFEKENTGVKTILRELCCTVHKTLPNGVVPASQSVQNVVFPLKTVRCTPCGIPLEKHEKPVRPPQTCKTLHNPVANVKMVVWNNLSAESYVREKENTGVKKNCAKQISISLKTLVHDKNAVCTLRGKLRFFALRTRRLCTHTVPGRPHPQGRPQPKSGRKVPKSSRNRGSRDLPSSQDTRWIALLSAQLIAIGHFG